MSSSPSVSLYGHWICPFVGRVAFALGQRGIEHDLIDAPPSAVRGPDFVLPDEFVAHSPRLEVPMLRIGDEYLADSIRILEWLEQQIVAVPLLPADPEARELVRERMAWFDEHVFRAMGGLYYGLEPDRIAQAAIALGNALDEMSEWLAETDWLAGDEPPRMEDHRRRCRDLAGWSAVEWSSDQTDEFVGRFQAYRRRKHAV